MQVLESALAFAIIMLVLSMVTTTIVETIHRALGLREQGLKYMLGRLFDQAMAGAVQRTGGGLTGVALQSFRNEFVDRMTANRAPMGVKPDGQATSTSWVDRVMGRAWNGDQLGTLSVTAFMERLGSDDVGAKLVAAAKAEAADAVDAVLQDVAQKFEAFGKDASTFFQSRARFVSVMVAIVIAFCLHVDAIDIFRTLMRDPAVRSRVIERTDKVIQQAEAGGTVTRGAPATTLAPQPATGAAEVEELKKKYEEAIKSLNSAKTELREIGIPIGWTEQRQNAAKLWFNAKCKNTLTKEDQPLMAAACQPGEQRVDEAYWNAASLGVYLSLLLGGLLIGLGGPFWFDAVKNLTNIRNLAQQAQASAPPAGAAPAGGAGGTTTPQPQTPVDVFKAANAARPVTGANVAPPRPQLNADGSVASEQT
jgi:hypothetical protein